MVVKVYKDAAAIGAAAGMVFASQVITKPDSVLGLATGSTPIPTYKFMIKAYEDGIVDYSKVTTFNLDEYVGLGHEHDQSYYYFMHDNLFNYINVPEESINVLSGTAADPDKECAEYEARIDAAGGIDLQILGIGRNGHIAFNEPADDFADKTHKVALTESTIEANKRFFASADDVPRYAVSMGIGSIMRAKKIILIATGADKADAIYALVKGGVTPQCPASILRMHSDVTIFCDEAAYSKCK
ncbi:MAG: glucosamine-6-phosphate deaminase [Clostridia bacterium]|nr:glucosamine-6-phosphate deaminase [Clostridia bacterium]